jgi:hypothetical protein
VVVLVVWNDQLELLQGVLAQVHNVLVEALVAQVVQEAVAVAAQAAEVLVVTVPQAVQAVL